MRILLVEENAQDYLHTRQVFDEQHGKFHIDWAPNYETALKLVKQHQYTAYLISYDVVLLSQRTFLIWLREHAVSPIILLTQTDKMPDDNTLIDLYKTDYLCKNRLTISLFERTLRHITHLIALRQDEQRCQAILNNSVELIILIKPSGILLEINQTALTFFGVQREIVLGTYLWDIQDNKLSSRAQTQFKSGIAKAAHNQLTRQEITLCDSKGQVVTLDCTLTPILNAQQQVRWIIVEGRDLSEYKLIEQELVHAAMHDQLTSLPNRYAFTEHLERTLQRIQENKQYRIALLYIDLDRFRVINESLGHDMGDWLLMEIAQRLRECVGKDVMLARSGGDEFMILMDDIQDISDATHLANTINQELAYPFLLDGYEVVTSASIGIAYSTNPEDSADLLRDVDTAMYRAKKMGKSCFVVFNKGMHSRAISRLKIEADLHRALEHEEFMLFYQPQIELSSEQLTGVEALIRFHHPQYGFIPPVEFVPILEDTGIIINLGAWILRTACHQLKAWLDEGLNISHISVNLSAHQFRSKRLLSMVTEALKYAGLNPSYLQLELTESVLMENTQTAIRVLNSFREMGIRVAIDDFGTGYASLSYLKRFPIDCLKIDKSFIDGVTSVPEDAAITVATMDMAHALGLVVTAEGVETIGQRDFLSDHGCDFVQGFLYAAPMDNNIFLQWAKQYNKIKNVMPLIFK